MKLLAASLGGIMAKIPAEEVLGCEWISVADFRRFDSGVEEVRGFFHENFIPQAGIDECLERLTPSLY